MIEVHIVPVSWSTHQAPLSQIRTQVFVEEQNIPSELEFDAEDATATHLLALDSTGVALGCARLLDSGLIGRVAVIKEARGNGHGRALVEATVAAAEANKITRVFLHAQESAQAFYQKLQFTSTGVRFQEAGIPHITMERALAIPFDTSGLTRSRIVRSEGVQPAATQSTPRVSRLLEFASEDSAIEQLHSVLGEARRTLRIYSPTLDHALFDTAEAVDLISNFARSASGTRVDILISDSALIVARGHLLIELGRRLDEKMAVRRLPKGVKADPQTWLVADTAALWVQSEPEEYRGWSDTYNVVQAERFEKRFTHLWDRSSTDPELRLLRI